MPKKKSYSHTKLKKEVLTLYNLNFKTVTSCLAHSLSCQQKKKTVLDEIIKARILSGVLRWSISNGMILSSKTLSDIEGTKFKKPINETMITISSEQLKLKL